jgi:hypothetical protein
MVGGIQILERDELVIIRFKINLKQACVLIEVLAKSRTGDERLR